MNIETDLKQLLSYHQSLDGNAFRRNVLLAVAQPQKQRPSELSVFVI